MKENSTTGIKRFINNVFESNSYVVYDSFHNAVIIDMGDFSPIFEFIKEYNLNIKALLITHTHYDHIYGIKQFMETFPEVPIYTSAFGKYAFGKSNRNFSRYHDDTIEIESENIKAISDEEILRDVEGMQFKAIATPGHDESCITYKCGNVLFTGDSYIPGIKVVSSFPKSDKILAEKWYSTLQALDGEYNIFPGHGAERIHKNITLI